MKSHSQRGFVFARKITSLALTAALSLFARADTAEGQRGMVVTVHPLATQAGQQTFQRGGNAIDAAVAAALTLGVVDGHNSGIGGGCVMLIRAANGRVVAIDGRELAPLAATRDMFIRNKRADPLLSQMGGLSVAVPGALMAYAHALNAYGRLKLSDHLLAAARIAEAGFPIDDEYAKRLAAHANDLNAFESSRAIFLNPNGSPKRAGEILRQPDLARTYRLIAMNGVVWFYNGPFAVTASDIVIRNGGILTADDFAFYQTRLRDPILSSYRGHTIIGFPPPSSGGILVSETLNILENFDIPKIGASNSIDVIHLTSEAMKIAFADRAHWLGDPDFTKVPRGLIAKPYAIALAKQIQTNRVTAVPGHGLPPRAQQDFFRQHTTHFSATDAAGNWVACTATINTSFGSKIVVPGTGVLLNNEMDDFSIQPGVPNYFGLVGAEANAIAPLKRPLTSMSPTIVLKGGQPILTLGAAGGPTIISQVIQTIINVVDFGADLESALGKSRFHHQWIPNELRVETTLGEITIADLQRRGHKVVAVDPFGVMQGIAKSSSGAFVGVSDPRVNGKAGGW